MRDPLPAFRIAAAEQLRLIEGKLKDWHGVVGLSLTRLVLTDGRSVEAAARSFGADLQREVRSVAWLFRSSLNCLAKALGLSSSRRSARPAEPRGARRRRPS